MRVDRRPTTTTVRLPMVRTTSRHHHRSNKQFESSHEGGGFAALIFSSGSDEPLGGSVQRHQVALATKIGMLPSKHGFRLLHDALVL